MNILPHLTQFQVIIVTLVFQIQNYSEPLLAQIPPECQVGETFERANMLRMFCLDTQIQPSLRSQSFRYERASNLSVSVNLIFMDQDGRP